MTQYKVYENPQGVRENVKIGWSWPAFFFGWVWAFFKKMWLLGGAVLCGLFVIGVIFAVADMNQEAADILNLLTCLGLSITFGINGNKWRESSLLSRGFTLRDIISG